MDAVGMDQHVVAAWALAPWFFAPYCYTDNWLFTAGRACDTAATETG